jgi:hypothetical protein
MTFVLFKWITLKIIHEDEKAIGTYVHHSESSDLNPRHHPLVLLHNLKRSSVEQKVRIVL